MTQYSPFEKELKKLTATDLIALNSAREGWYIEYKRELPTTSGIAKSISAFSNTYGGWLFFGIEEKSKEEPVAGKFPGIPRKEIDAARQRIRQSAATQITPSPHFEVEVLWGPCDEIGLEIDRGIICIQIPRSIATPHVHKSGQIYRRIADSSEPKPENDRFILDQLWRRADDIRKGYKRWVKADPELAKDEFETPYLRLLIVPDLWGDHNLQMDLSVDQVRELMQSSKESGLQVPFETVHTAAHGFIGRQLFNNSPHNLGLTWRLWTNSASDVLLPFRKIELDDLKKVRSELVGFDHGEQFQEMLISQNYNYVRILDLNFLYMLIHGVVRIQQRFADKINWNGPWFVKGKLLNVWRTSPFIDIAAVLNQFGVHGIPMCLNKKVTVLPGTGPESFFKVEAFDNIEDYEARIATKALCIFGLIAKAFGLPGWMEIDDEGENGTFYMKLYEAGQRPKEAQRLRKERIGTRTR